MGYYFAKGQNGTEAKEAMTMEVMGVLAELFRKDLPRATMRLESAMDSDLRAEMSTEEWAQLALDVSAMMLSQGDGQLQRVAKYVKPCDNHMSEQICEGASASGGGQEIGAHDLTSSYGTVLSAMYYRGQAVTMGVQPWQIEWAPVDYAFGLQEDCGANICSGQCHD